MERMGIFRGLVSVVTVATLVFGPLSGLFGAPVPHAGASAHDTLLTQRAYIFENDDGANVNANSSLEAGNVPATNIKKGQRLAVRVQVDNTTGTATSAETFGLFYDRNDGYFTKVGERPLAATPSGCEPASTIWNCEEIDDGSLPEGWYLSLAISPTGIPWISYQEDGGVGGYRLRAAHYMGFGGTGCGGGVTSWTCETIDDPAGGDSPAYRTTIAFHPLTGEPWILHENTGPGPEVAYHVGTGGAGCDGTTAWTCESVAIETIGQGFMTERGSLAFDAAGNAWVAYAENNGGSLRAANRVGVGGTGCNDGGAGLWNCEIVDNPAGLQGWYTSIAIAPDGNPWITYADIDADSILVAHRVAAGGTGCTNATNPTLWICETLDDPANALFYTSIAFDPQGDAWIVYAEGTVNQLVIARRVAAGGFGCRNATNPGLWICELLHDPANGDSVIDPSLAFSTEGIPWVAYRNSTANALELARRVGAGGTGCGGTAAWTCEVIDDPANAVGLYPSLAFDPFGDAWIGYLDSTDQTPKIARVMRGGEIRPSAGKVGANGDTLTAARAAACTGGTAFANGKWFEGEESSSTTIAGNTCTELAFVVETSRATLGQTYRFVLARKSSWRADRGPWSGMASIVQRPTLTMVSSTPTKASFDTTPVFANCDDTLFGCEAVDDPANLVGQYSAIAFGPDGVPWVSYHDQTAVALKVAQYTPGTGAVGGCAANWTCTMVEDTADITGHTTDITVDPSGVPWVSYRNSTTQALEVAQYVGAGGAGCTSAAWTCTVVDDPANNVGSWTSIVLDRLGQPWVSYQDVSANALKIARYVSANGTGCTSAAWTCTTVDDPANNVGAYTSIGFDAYGNPWASYYDSTAGALKLARFVGSQGTGCTDTRWACEVVDDPAAFVGYYTSLAFDASGNAWISYRDGTAATLKVARYVGTGGVGCTNATNSARWSCTTVDDPTNSVGEYTAIAIDPSGNPWVAHRDSAVGALRVSRYVGSGGTGCADAAWTCSTVDAGGISEGTGLAFDRSGIPWATSFNSGTLQVTKLHRPHGANDLRYFLQGFEYAQQINADDTVRQQIVALTASESPLFVFVENASSNQSLPHGLWNGQSSVAATAAAFALDVFDFTSPSSWRSVLSSSTCAANTDCTLEGHLGGGAAQYYNSQNQTFWRAWQAAGGGTPTFRSDLVSVTLVSSTSSTSDSTTTTSGGDSTTANEPAPTNTETATISPDSGGSVTETSANDGATATVTADAGTVAEDTTFTVQAFTAQEVYAQKPLPAELAMGTQSVFEVSATAAGEAITTFVDKPLTLRFTYQENRLAQGASEADLRLATFDETENDWYVLEDAVVDTATNTVTYDAAHLTRFALVRPASTTPPSPPTNLTASVIENGVRLAWANPSSGFHHARIVRNDRLLLTNVQAALYDDATAAAGERYEYVVSAVDRAGNISDGVRAAILVAPSIPQEEQQPPPERVSSPEHGDVADGALVRADNDFRVFIVRKIAGFTMIRHLVDPAVPLFYGHLGVNFWNLVRPVESLGSARPVAWVRCGDCTGLDSIRVWEVNADGTRHWMNMTWEHFVVHTGNDLAFADAAIFEINSRELSHYAVGPSVLFR